MVLGLGAVLLLGVGLWSAYEYFAGAGRGADVLATVGDTAITQEAFVQEMARRGGERPGQYQTVEQRRALLDRMIEQQVLVAAAARAGFDRDPEVIRQYERALVDRFLAVRLEPRMAELRVSDAEVATHYEERQEDYARPPRRRGAVILARLPENASAEAEQEARQRLDRAVEETGSLDPDVLHFGAIARKYSDDRASRYQGGMTGWVVRHPGRSYRWGDAVVDALFAIEQPGHISSVIRTGDGLWIVRLVDAEPAAVRPLERLESGIRNRLLQDKRAAERQRFLDQAAAGVEVTVNEAALAALEPLSPPAPPKADLKPPPVP